jgi:phosphoglycolate phosphatase-like HAD superfamily hydrolase
MSERSFIYRAPLPVYIVTSSPAPFPQTVCAAVPDLAPLVGRIVSGDQFDPDKAAGLKLAIRRMGLQPDQVVFIGDARSDLAAAKHVGCRFVYYVRDPESADAEIPPEIPRISRHGEFLSLGLENVLGVAYDFDGTIVGTVALHEEAWRAAGERFGVAIPAEFLRFQMGKKNEEAAAWLLGAHYAEIGRAFIAVKEAFVASNAHKATYFEDFSDALAALIRA